jgi:aryl-alcohol dehydrogenase-like predicted oxidoreductase
MNSRALGQTDLRTPPIVFGSMENHNQTDETRVKVLRTAIDHGLTTIDTAPLYGFGRAEKQIALALEGRPNHNVQIFTKLGLRWDVGDYGDVLFDFTDSDGRHGRVCKDSRPESVRWEVEQSLERLNMDTLDLVQIHHPDVHTPLAETMGALLELRAEGKIRHIGVSNFSPDQILAAQLVLGDVPLASVQPEYSLVRRSIEVALLPLCILKRIGVLAYSPLARGVLTANPKLELSRRIRRGIERTLRPIAVQHNASLAAVALAWVRSQPGVCAAIAGASKSEQIVELVAGLEIDLSREETESLSTEFAGAQLEDAYIAQGGLIRKARRFVGRSLRRLGLLADKV